MDEAPSDHESEIDETPSRVTSWLMVVVGVLFLLPFLFVTAAEAPSLGSLLSALLTVGWTFGLGIVFLVFGVKRLVAASADAGAP